MRLRYYLRGLGIGVAVTAIIMSVSANGKNRTMTDAQIIARAKELGMVDGVLTEFAETEQPDDEEAEDPAGIDSSAESAEITEGAVGESELYTEESGENGEEIEGEGVDDSEAQEPEEAGESAEQQEYSEPQPGTERISTVTVAVYPGEGSHTISRKLAALGLVESADIYDNYLCQNGYDKKLCAGNYVIPEGASAEEIAKILTSSN